MARRPRSRKKQLLPFGDMMVPIVGLVGIGLLFFGIRVFFVSDKEEPYREYIKQEMPPEDQWNSTAGPVGFLPPKVETDNGNGSFVAVPVINEGSTQPLKPKKPEKPRSTPNKPAEPAAVRPPASPKPVKPKPSQGYAQWFVQIGSFRQKSSAESVVSGAKSRGISASIGLGDVNGVRYYKVLVPGGKTREQAVALGEKLKTMGYDYFVFSGK